MPSERPRSEMSSSTSFLIGPVPSRGAYLLSSSSTTNTSGRRHLLLLEHSGSAPRRRRSAWRGRGGRGCPRRSLACASSRRRVGACLCPCRCSGRGAHRGGCGGGVRMRCNCACAAGRAHSSARLYSCPSSRLSLYRRARRSRRRLSTRSRGPWGCLGRGLGQLGLDAVHDRAEEAAGVLGLGEQEAQQALGHHLADRPEEGLDAFTAAAGRREALGRSLPHGREDLHARERRRAASCRRRRSSSRSRPLSWSRNKRSSPFTLKTSACVFAASLPSARR